MLIVVQQAMGDVPVESAGALSAPDVSDDVGVRHAVVQEAADAITKAFGAVADADEDGSGHVDPDAEDDGSGGAKSEGASAPIAGTSAAGGRGRAGKYPLVNAPEGEPRVNAPEVEGSAAMAIREDTPGYIVQAFPKLFPHGVGDFHSHQGGRTAPSSPLRLLSFSSWGKYVMTWHDGRFMRHTRFRYWLLDTSLRLMTPGMQRTFSERGRQQQITH